MSTLFNCITVSYGDGRPVIDRSLAEGEFITLNYDPSGAKARIVVGRAPCREPFVAGELQLGLGIAGVSVIALNEFEVRLTGFTAKVMLTENSLPERADADAVRVWVTLSRS